MASDDDKKDEFLGFVILNDYGVDNTLSIVGKAFRQASPICLIADRTITERV